MKFDPYGGGLMSILVKKIKLFVCAPDQIVPGFFYDLVGVGAEAHQMRSSLGIVDLVLSLFQIQPRLIHV